MLALVTEGARHAAAAGIQIDDLAAGNARQQAQRRSCPDQGLLMAVGMEEHALWPSCKRQRGLLGPFFKCYARLRDAAGGLLLLAAEQSWMIVADGRVAAGFDKDDR